MVKLNQKIVFPDERIGLVVGILHDKVMVEFYNPISYEWFSLEELERIVNVKLGIV